MQLHHGTDRLEPPENGAWPLGRHGLELLAVTIDVKLDNTAISEEPQPICMRISCPATRGQEASSEGVSRAFLCVQ